jgi:hypothetical protein
MFHPAQNHTLTPSSKSLKLTWRHAVGHCRQQVDTAGSQPEHRHTGGSERCIVRQLLQAAANCRAATGQPAVGHLPGAAQGPRHQKVVTVHGRLPQVTCSCLTAESPAVDGGTLYTASGATGVSARAALQVSLQAHYGCLITEGADPLPPQVFSTFQGPAARLPGDWRAGPPRTSHSAQHCASSHRPSHN